MIVGCGIPKIVISPDRLDPALGVTEIRIHSQHSWQATIWPYSFASFEYRYKKFRTLDEVRTTGGKPEWQPSIEKDTDGKLVKKENGPDTIVLGEWKETNKKSLFAREREEIVIHFRSSDGIQAVVKAYIKFLVWDVSAAISATYQFKVDPEKTIIDKFQDWAKNKKYFTDINGISFEKMDENDLNAKNFFTDLNKSIYMTGVIVEDVELTEFIIEPDSKDVAEAQEKIIESQFLLQAEEIEADRKEKVGEGNRRQKEKENLATKDLLEKEAAVAVSKDKELKQNEVGQYQKMKKIDLNVNGKLLTKLEEYKKVGDKTEIAKYRALGKVTGTLVLHEASSKGGSNLDDVIEGNIITKTFDKKEGGN